MMTKLLPFPPTHLTCATFMTWTFVTSAAVAQDWQPQKAALMTKWAGDVSPGNVHPEYPRPQMVRKDWMNLNGLWQFEAASSLDSPPIGRELAKKILVPFPVESALSGVMQRVDKVWYRRTFDRPESWSGKRTLLHFGAVDWETIVWVNGKKVGDHRGGYDGFSFDITDALTTHGSQEIIVGVSDPTDGSSQPRGKQVRNPHGIWYTPTTGIWQTVWLEPVPKSYIAGLKIETNADEKSVSISPTYVGTSGRPKVRIRIGATAGIDSAQSTKISALADIDVPMTIRSSDFKLWSPASPNLYDFTVELSEGETVVDQVSSYFGLRKIEVKPDAKGINRIMLNGEFVFQVGPLDQGFWPDGLYTAPTDEAMKYDLDMTTRLGFNMIRKHVKVEPDRWYYWCDKLGILVWQDMPSGDAYVASGKGEIKRNAASSKQFEDELRRLIDGRRNHPSIVMWVVFNEGWGQYDTARLSDWTKRYDPSRLVCGASGWNDLGTGDVHDIHIYPGPGAPPTSAKRAGVLGEFGGLGLPIKGHLWTDKNWGYKATKDQADLTQRYVDLLTQVHKLKRDSGLSAAVYTQTTDVETETNGLLTYDRKVLKVDEKKVSAANRGE